VPVKRTAFAFRFQTRLCLVIDVATYGEIVVHRHLNEFNDDVI